MKTCEKATMRTEMFSPDLEGVVVGETKISNVDGGNGVLSYRGYPIGELVERPFMHVVHLVLFGDWPDAIQSDELEQFMLANSQLSDDEIAMLKALPVSLHPMLMLQAAVPTLGATQPQSQQLSLLHNHPLKGSAQLGLFIAAKLPSLLAAWYRLKNGKEIVANTDASRFHENFLTMFHGAKPTEAQLKVLDATQILQMEHSFNAGTFAGRVCASTQAPIQSVISASIGTLFGVLHGGADQAALEMAMQIGTPEKAAAYVDECLANKVKIMGMGHREYKTVDPRACILKPMAAELCHDAESQNLLKILMAVEDACRVRFSEKGKDIWANVEFYKGAVFHSLGIPTEFFTALFAMGRVYGYIAHFLEFNEHSRLIRPRARYVGK